VTSPGGRITVSIAVGIASVEIDDPAHRNALTKAMCIDLEELMPQLDADPAVLAVTIRGAGAAFSSGAAIGELTSVLMDPQEDGTQVDHLSRADQAIASMSKPTIAVVDGACMGGGWQIASACDFVVASERSVFAITPAKLGVIYPRAGIERLVRQVGPATAKYLLLTGVAVPAAQARELGLVAVVVADEEFAAACSALVETVVQNSRFSMHTLKSLVDATASSTPQRDERWAEAWAAMVAGPDMTIGVEAFLHRERPRFTWVPQR
jgi:enoyl-CoA hydratase/carnithine racemase